MKTFHGHRLAWSRSRCRSVSGSRGFTLVELMVVALIITILAVIAVPGLARRMDNYAALQVAQGIASLVRGARMQALGRGAAVLVRYQNGRFEVYEAIQGGLPANGQTMGAGCDTLPRSSCLDQNPWITTAGNPNHLIDVLNVDTSDFNISFEAQDGTATVNTATSLDICFTPFGQTYISTSVGTAMTQMLGPARGTVTLASGTGLSRNVLIPPNGNSRVVAR